VNLPLESVRRHPCGVTLERGSGDVPADGRWHVTSQGAVVGSFRSEKQALEEYQRQVVQSGWVAPKSESLTRVDVSALAAEESLARAEEFWSSAHQFRRRGGKGRL
jgi:hypothetical protein